MGNLFFICFACTFTDFHTDCQIVPKFDFCSQISTSKIIRTWLIFFLIENISLGEHFLLLTSLDIFSDICFKNLLDADSSPQNSPTKVMLRDGVGVRIKAPHQDNCYRLLFLRSIFYTNLHELFCHFISWTNWVNSGKFMDNRWISCQIMADMENVYNDLIIINLCSWILWSAI